MKPLFGVALAAIVSGCLAPTASASRAPAPAPRVVYSPPSLDRPPPSDAASAAPGALFGGDSYGATVAPSSDAASAAPGALFGGDSYGATVAPAPAASSSSHFDAQRLGIARAFIASLATTHSFYSSLLRFVNDPSRRASMLAGATDGGFFVGATRKTPTARNEYANVATVYRADAAGALRWTADVGDVGFATFELMAVLGTTDGGAIAQVLAYKHPARNPNTRFVKLDRDGHRVWVLQLPGTGNTDCGQAEVVRSDGRGGVEIDGYWVRSKELTDVHDWSGHLRTWSGAISADGRLVRSEVGGLMLTSTIGTWPDQPPIWSDL